MMHQFSPINYWVKKKLSIGTVNEPDMMHQFSPINYWIKKNYLLEPLMNPLNKNWTVLKTA